DALTARMRAANTENAGMRGLVLPIWQSHWGVQDALRAPLVVLLAACGLVLVIVCANAAGLLLARGRLVRQLLTETSLLAVAGAALGLVGPVWLARTLRLFIPAFAVPSLANPHVDAAVLAFTLSVAAGVTLLAGIAPSLHASRSSFGDVLNDARAAGVGV